MIINIVKWGSTVISLMLFIYNNIYSLFFLSSDPMNRTTQLFDVK